MTLIDPPVTSSIVLSVMTVFVHSQVSHSTLCNQSPMCATRQSLVQLQISPLDACPPATAKVDARVTDE